MPINRINPPTIGQVTLNPNLTDNTTGVGIAPNFDWMGSTYANHPAYASRIPEVIPAVQLFHTRNGIAVRFHDTGGTIASDNTMDIYVFPTMKDAIEFLFSRLCAEKMGAASSVMSKQL